MGAVAYAVFGFALVGVVLLLCLCKKVPRLHRSGRSATSIPHSAENYARVSVVIPVHNAAHELPALLADLHNQSLEPVEIVCVDMQSTDDTALVALRLGAKVLSFDPQKAPPLWGKHMEALQQGVQASSGDYFLFFQSNLRLAPEAVASMVSAYRKNGMPLSLRPYHMLRRSYEQISLFVYFFGAFLKGIGLPGKQRHKDYSFYEEALVFSRYHWELFTAEDSRKAVTVPEPPAEAKIYDAECTALQLAVAILPPEEERFSAGTWNRSPASIHHEGASPPWPAAAFSTTAAAGYAVEKDDLLFASESTARQPSLDDSYNWMRNRFAEQQMPLRVMLGARLLRCRNYPNGWRRFLGKVVDRVANDLRTSTQSMCVLVGACILGLLASSFGIAYAVASHSILAVLAGVAIYAVCALTIFAKSRFIGIYHPMMYLFFPIPLLFYGFCAIAALFKKLGRHQKDAL